MSVYNTDLPFIFLPTPSTLRELLQREHASGNVGLFLSVKFLLQGKVWSPTMNWHPQILSSADISNCSACFSPQSQANITFRQFELQERREDQIPFVPNKLTTLNSNTLDWHVGAQSQATTVVLKPMPGMERRHTCTHTHKALLCCSSSRSGWR